MSSVIKIRDLSKVYDMGATQVHALRELTLDIAVNEYVAIMCPSGSGKSTLLNILGCLDVASAGLYELDGQLVSDMDDDELARVRNEEIGYVFQTFTLLPRSDAISNVELTLVYGGTPAGERQDDGAYPEGTVHALVKQRLQDLGKALKKSTGNKDDDHDPDATADDADEDGDCGSCDK